MAIPHRVNADVLDEILPQTQCGQCGYAGCRPYAEAMAAGQAPVNRCPPGGVAVMQELAGALGCSPMPLDEACGISKPPAVAVIDESWCIGCTLCIAACPVDAIVGAAKRMHTVIADACTGCELCIPPCPVDCITMEPVTRAMDVASRKARAAEARMRYQRRNARLARLTPLVEKLSPKKENGGTQTAVARALQRARARIASRENP